MAAALDPRLPIAPATREELAYGPLDGRRARLLQELLTVRDFPTAVDGDPGPATSRQLAAFQRSVSLRATGEIDAATWAALIAPVLAACAIPDVAPGTPAGDVVAAVARQHAAARPREIPPNSGIWVRLYMGGNQGRAWPWCAGFVTFVLRQAAAALEDAGAAGALEKAKHWRTFSCDILADRGRLAGTLAVGADVAGGRREVRPGDVFLVRASPRDWVHTGFVVEPPARGLVKTIEGNTNAAGGREGLYVLARERKLSGALDFVRCPMPDAPARANPPTPAMPPVAPRPPASVPGAPQHPAAKLPGYNGTKR